MREVGFTAVTVLDMDSLDTGNVKEHKVKGTRRHHTWFSVPVAKLIGGTKLEKRNQDEELPSPFLKRWLEGSRDGIMYYLDAV